MLVITCKPYMQQYIVWAVWAVGQYIISYRLAESEIKQSGITVHVGSDVSVYGCVCVWTV